MSHFYMMAIKIAITALVVAIGTAVCFVDPKANNAGPDWLWRLGKSDPVRVLLFSSNGQLRRFTKLGLLAWFAMIVSLLWIFAPNS
jgi:hypothetical protein